MVCIFCIWNLVNSHWTPLKKYRSGDKYKNRTSCGSTYPHNQISGCTLNVRKAWVFSSIFFGSFLSCFWKCKRVHWNTECSRVECHINMLPIEMLSPDHCPSERLRAACSVVHLGTDPTPQEEFTPADSFVLSCQRSRRCVRRAPQQWPACVRCFTCCR